MLRFLHLSDIHFATTFDDVPEVDVDAQVRDRMLIDFAQMRERRGPFDAILLVGDIAARGKPAEYATATHFLKSAAEIVGCPSDQVICVPGNHDIDRGLQSPAHGHVRTGLRSMPAEQISDDLVRLLRDDLSAAVMFAPLTAYNQFALGFACDLGPSRLMWPPKTFQLGERTVRVHGITSCWIADESDKPEAGSQLVCGVFQVGPVGSDPDTINVTLCHHPPRWLRDAALLQPWIAQASLVLTGHEHEAGLTRSDDERTLYIASGAVNPERTEGGWIPAYNVVELEQAGEDATHVDVSIFVRTWRGAQGHAEFGPSPDYDDPFTTALAIGATGQIPVPPAAGDEIVEILPAEPMTSARHSQIHTIMQASPDDRHRVARELELEIPSELSGIDADRAILRLALERDALAELAALLVQGSDDV